jgi:hypothetical protein
MSGANKITDSMGARHAWKSFFFSFFFLALEPILASLEEYQLLEFLQQDSIVPITPGGGETGTLTLDTPVVAEKSRMKLRAWPNWAKAVRAENGLEMPLGETW